MRIGNHDTRHLVSLNQSLEGACCSNFSVPNSKYDQVNVWLYQEDR